MRKLLIAAIAVAAPSALLAHYFIVRPYTDPAPIVGAPVLGTPTTTAPVLGTPTTTVQWACVTAAGAVTGALQATSAAAEAACGAAVSTDGVTRFLEERSTVTQTSTVTTTTPTTTTTRTKRFEIRGGTTLKVSDANAQFIITAGGGGGPTVPSGGDPGGDSWTENFDSWPDTNTSSPGIKCGTSTSYQNSACNYHLARNAVVQAHAECLAGKCWKYTYTFDEDTASMYPCSESDPCNNGTVFSVADHMSGGTPGANDDLYVSIRVRFGSDVPAGTGLGTSNSQLKLVRFIGDIPYFTAIRDGKFHDEYGSCSTGTNLSNYTGEWLRLVSYHSNTDNDVKLWAYRANGTLLGSCTNSNYTFSEGGGSSSFSRIAFIFANFSSSSGWPPGGSGTSSRTVFMDDICVADSEAKGEYECAP
jgi:hypothetical protein